MVDCIKSRLKICEDSDSVLIVFKTFTNMIDKLYDSHSSRVMRSKTVLVMIKDIELCEEFR